MCPQSGYKRRERARVSMRARASLNCRVSSCLFGGGSEQARGWEGAGRIEGGKVERQGKKRKSYRRWE